MTRLVEPHGGTLVDRFVTSVGVEPLREHAKLLPKLQLDGRELADLELIATGAVSPLRGFLGSRDYFSVLERMRLADGTVWPLPLTLALDRAQATKLQLGNEVTLCDSSGGLRAVLSVSEVYERNPLVEARQVYQTDSVAHPGVAYLLSRPTWLLAGEIKAFPLPKDLPFTKHRLTPAALREKIRLRGWTRVAGFQTRNPIHRAHEHLTKLALEFADGLVIHPLVGETKNDDVPASVRFQAYELLVEKYYPKDRTLLAAFPAAMRYAGPREALFHALVRKNYGISHFIVGRDHAGVGRFYGPFDAHQFFDAFTPEELGVSPLKFDAAFYCRACDSLASPRTCPHDGKERLELSGSAVREILRSGGQLPEEFTRPEIASLLREHYVNGKANSSELKDSSAENSANGIIRHQPESVNGSINGSELKNKSANGSPNSTLQRQQSSANESAAHRPEGPLPVGFILWFTGLSGAGKSTLAQAIDEELGSIRHTQILDGDEVRTFLSKGLGFSKEDRDTNIQRIGYVARVLARNGAVAVVAAISPYAETRNDVRRLATEEGIPFFEIHVDASLEVLIQRDVKGLYKKALAGEIEHFTGVSDPYEPPIAPDLVVHSDREPVHESIRRILILLRKELDSFSQQLPVELRS